MAIFISLFLLSGFYSFAQSKSSISGTITDSANQKLLQYVTVALYRQNDTIKALKSGYTSDKGKSSFNGIDSGSYILYFSHTGFAEKQIAETVPTNGAIEIPPVTLTTATGTALGGVTVKAAGKPLVEIADDKVIFNAENDPSSKTSTAIDILRKTPFVSVDGDNNVTVNGQTNFKVLLNSRVTAMFSGNVKEALKGFPGAIITRIEVITSPSAKYDAEGVGGIINIITQKKVVRYNGSANIWYLNKGWYNINANLSAKYGRFGFSMNYSAGGANNVPQTSRMETVPLVAAPFNSRALQGSHSMTNFWNFGNAELSYELDSLNIIAMYGNVSGGYNRLRMDQSITTSYQSSPDSVSFYNLDSHNEYPTTSMVADY